MIDSFKELENVLKKDERLVANDGTLLINEIINFSSHLDSKLLELLLANDNTKNMFFKKVNDIEVFDKQLFNWIINSKKFLPDSYTRFSQKIGLIDYNGSFIKKNEDVTLAFPNKDCFLEFDSTDEDENRDEIFFNETLAKNEIDVLKEPKVFSMAKRITKNNETEDVIFKQDDNLIIHGNNLLTMYSLKARYKNQIKLMYWDILYNTKNDKVPYNDSFKHSSWLVMMKNRLEIALDLLKNDSFLCMQCDDNEMAYLKVLTDEVFGREKFVSCIAVKMSDASGPKMNHVGKTFPKLKEYLLIYKKGNPKINVIREEKRVWDDEYKNFFDIPKDMIDKIKNNTISEEEVNQINSNLDKNLINIEEAMKRYGVKNNKNNRKEFLKENSYRIARSSNASSIRKFIDEKKVEPRKAILIKFSDKYEFLKTDYDKSSSDPRVQYVFASDTMNVPLCDLWTEINTSFNAEGGVTLKNGQKPEKLMQYIIESLSDEGDIVLDAYLGSGTTAAVCQKLNRQYIGIEQLNSHIEKTLTRLKNVLQGEKSGISESINWNGGGEFVYFELAKSNMNIVQQIQNSTDEHLDKIYEELSKSDFLNYRVDKKMLNESNSEFNDLDYDTKRKILFELLDKNLLYINYSDIENSTYSISDKDKKFTKSFYEE